MYQDFRDLLKTKREIVRNVKVFNLMFLLIRWFVHEKVRDLRLTSFLVFLELLLFSWSKFLC